MNSNIANIYIPRIIKVKLSIGRADVILSLFKHNRSKKLWLFYFLLLPLKRNKYFCAYLDT